MIVPLHLPLLLGPGRRPPALVAELVCFDSGVQDGNSVSVGVRVDTPGDRPAVARGPAARPDRIYVHGVLDPTTPAESLSGGRFADVLAFLMASLNSHVLVREANLELNVGDFPSVITLYNAAIADVTLTTRILRAFFNKYIRVECGSGLHLSMSALRSHRKAARLAFVETMIKKHRYSPGKLEYFFDAPDPRQMFEEGMLGLAALDVVARECYRVRG
jgi:hypothetical protein